MLGTLRKLHSGATLIGQQGGGDQLRDNMRAHRVTDEMRPLNAEVVEEAQDVEAHLWSIQRGVVWLVAAPVTFEVDGKQYVTIAAGTEVFTFGLFEPVRPVPLLRR